MIVSEACVLCQANGGSRLCHLSITLIRQDLNYALTRDVSINISGASDRFTLYRGRDTKVRTGDRARASYPSRLGLVRPKLIPLADETILVVGGDFRGAPTAEIFDPISNRFSETAALAFEHVPTSTATVLSDGNILFVGGRNGDIAELYLTDSQEFVALPSPGASRFGHTATLLPDGRVALIGGVSDVTGDSHDVVEYFDPTTRTFLPGPALPSPRNGHAAALLGGGKVLIAGGTMSTSGSSTTLASAVILDPSTGTYTSLSPSQGAYTQALALTDGRVLMGGSFFAAQAEIFDGQSFSAPIQAAARHVSGTMTLLPDGSVLAVGGWGGGFNPSNTDEAEIFDPRADAFHAVAPVGEARINHGAALLPDGRVLIAGGSAFDDAAYIFTPPACYSG